MVYHILGSNGLRSGVMMFIPFVLSILSRKTIIRKDYGGGYIL